MKAHLTSNYSLAILLVALQTPFDVALIAAPAPAPGKSAPQPKTPPAPVEPEIPQSNFTLPTNDKEGKDPFFPASRRPYTTGAVVRPTTTPKPLPTMNFVLNGISPSADKPFAMINGRTFGNNEEGDIVTAAGRAHIRCVEIKADSVIIEFRGERQELRLRKGL
jgi:hypothetical protein